VQKVLGGVSKAPLGIGNVTIARVWLEQGHGWNSRRAGEFDPGAVFGGEREADLIAQVLRNVPFRRHQLRGITFATLPELSITELVAWVNRNSEPGDYLISVHVNSAPRAEAASGVEVVYPYNAPLERRVDAELLGKTFAAHLSRPFRRVLRDDETPAGKEKPNGVKGLPIVRDVKIPALLIELGFINSATDRRAVKERGEDALAAALQALALSKGGA
jgi:N-acetylmuramoyl-L-alanine amidase